MGSYFSTPNDTPESHVVIDVDPSLCFSVMSYNILFSRYTTSTFGYCSPEILAWSYRCPRILEQLAADIVCLQELGCREYDYFLSDYMEEKGYSGVYAHKPGGKKHTKDGLGIFFRDELFESVEMKKVYLKSNKKSRNKVPNSLYADLQSRKDIALIQVLRCLTTGKLLLVCNVHLFYNPRYPDVKLMQMLLVLKAVESMKERLEIDSCIIAGDFNSLPNDQVTIDGRFCGPNYPRAIPTVSGVYQLLATGNVPCTHYHHPMTKRGILADTAEEFGNDINHPRVIQECTDILDISTTLNLRSAYFVSTGKEPEVTNYKPNLFQGTLDYIWVSSGLEVFSTKPLPSLQEIIRGSGLPSEEHPSDHLPIEAHLFFKT